MTVIGDRITNMNKNTQLGGVLLTVVAFVLLGSTILLGMVYKSLVSTKSAHIDQVRLELFSHAQGKVTEFFNELDAAQNNTTAATSHFSPSSMIKDAVNDYYMGDTETPVVINITTQSIEDPEDSTSTIDVPLIEARITLYCLGPIVNQEGSSLNNMDQSFTAKPHRFEVKTEVVSYLTETQEPFASVEVIEGFEFR